MTAATWAQAKKLAGCECGSADKIMCAVWQNLPTQFCNCPCHTYQRVDMGHELRPTGSGTCK